MVVALLFSLFSILLCVNSQTNSNYAVTVDGAEVINFVSPTISYTSNLQMDNNITTDIHTLYFTAGRRLFNLYTAQFNTNPSQLDKNFWASGIPLQTAPSPFLSFSTLRNNIIGPALPSNFSSSIADVIIQSVYLGTQPSIVEYKTPGLSIVSTIISPIADPSTGNHFVYLAGWDNKTNSNFVVARATIKPDQQDQSFQLNFVTDVLEILLDPPCYDQFDEIVHPQMYLLSDQLIVLVPKRCSLFIKITLPTNPLTPFGESAKQLFSPAVANLIYVSSAVFDPLYSVIYYTTKAYNTYGAKLYSFNTTTWTTNSLYTDLDLIESEILLVLGSDISPMTRYIFIIASGANKVQRLSIANNNTFYSPTAAALSPSFNHISSAWYYRPSLYFTTYEPDAKVGRIPKANFCKDWCGDYGYCTNGYCSCREGYTFVGIDPANLCVLSSVISEEDKEKETQGAAATLGVLFAFSLLAAIAGWVMWWRTRKLHKLPGSY